jgi:cytochrome c oxidase assembly protein Cox11
MKEANLQAMSVKELVELFTGYALQQDDAVLAFDVKETNRLYWKLEEVEDELKSRPGDQRHALLPLLEHPNPQVQVKAAKAILAIAPAAARQVLETIAETCYGPQKLEAGMSLMNLDRGIYKPT